MGKTVQRARLKICYQQPEPRGFDLQKQNPKKRGFLVGAWEFASGTFLDYLQKNEN
jgi:hypothetical protein